MTTTGPVHELAPAARPHELLVPIVLELAPIRRLLVIDVADDPTYRGLEPQILDGPEGCGMVLLAYRHDGRVEVYAESRLRLDPSGYEGLGEGLLGIYRTAFEQARFDVTADGLKVDVSFSAPGGRRVDLRIHEHLTGPRDRFPVLAPVGGAFGQPAFFPFLWLPGLSFVPVAGTDVCLRVDGEQRTVRRLPLPVGGRRCLMARYDPDVMVCQVNPDWVAELPRVPTRPIGTAAAHGVGIVDVDGYPGIGGVRVSRGNHTCSVELDPPLPDLTAVRPSTHHQGTNPAPGRRHHRAPRTLRARPHRRCRRARDRPVRALAYPATTAASRPAVPPTDLPPVADDLPLAGHARPHRPRGSDPTMDVEVVSDLDDLSDAVGVPAFPAGAERAPRLGRKGCSDARSGRSDPSIPGVDPWPTTRVWRSPGGAAGVAR
jgi:hypothetical protein